MSDTTNSMSAPAIGMLAWEGGGQLSLVQLETIPGNIVHPETFGFPIRIVRVKGANYQTVVERPNIDILNRMIETARELENAGVKAITTSCGFNAIFQNELANAVDVPVFTSSLLQVPMIHHMLRHEQKIGIITADKRSLTNSHLSQVGITESIPVCIRGMENSEEFFKARTDPDAKVDSAKFIKEIVEVAKLLITENLNVGAIVLECTDLPPAASAIRDATGLPVFDIVTLINMVHQSVTDKGWQA